MAENYYTLLRVPRDAPVADIEDALRVERMKWSRRVNIAPRAADRHEAEERVELLGAVKGVLTDPARRAAHYDQTLGLNHPEPDPAADCATDSTHLAARTSTQPTARSTPATLSTNDQPVVELPDPTPGQTTAVWAAAVRGRSSAVASKNSPSGLDHDPRSLRDQRLRMSGPVRVHGCQLEPSGGGSSCWHHQLDPRRTRVRTLASQVSEGVPLHSITSEPSRTAPAHEPGRS